YSIAKHEKTKFAKSEITKLVQKYKKERDEAFRKGESTRDKLKLVEITTRTQIEELRQKVRDLSKENRILSKTLKTYRIELGLESDPRFRGKMTKDVVKELQEKEEECRDLAEENSSLKFKLAETTSEFDQIVTSKSTLQEKLQAIETEMQELIGENASTLKLLEETKLHRDEVEQANMFLRQALSQKQEMKHFSNKYVQTMTSIPVYQKAYRRSSRELVTSQLLFHQETEKMRKKFEELPKMN
uniref:Zgc:113691 n=1 Tax=Latimeria chalumnae TaxID=7897 RepID=H3ANW0_LATCH